MSIQSNRRRLASTISVLAVALSVGIAQPAYAQLTTATIRGHITNSAAPAPGTTVTAKSVDTGAVSRAVAGPDGGYVLTGLSPGSYDVTFSGAGGAAVTQRVIVGVGQSASLDMDLAAPAASAAEAGAPATTASGNAIVVTGRRLVETRTSEVATNVTAQQIENLPSGQSQLPQFRDSGSRSEARLVGRVAPDIRRWRRRRGSRGRELRWPPGQRLHRRRQPQEQRPAGRRRRAGRQRGQSLLAARGEGVSGAHLELQGGV